MTNRQLKTLAVVAAGWLGLALISAKIVSIFTDSMLWQGFPYVVALLICGVYLLSLYRTGHQPHRSEEVD